MSYHTTNKVKLNFIWPQIRSDMVNRDSDTHLIIERDEIKGLEIVSLLLSLVDSSIICKFLNDVPFINRTTDLVPLVYY